MFNCAAGNLAHAEAEHDALRQHLIIENEIIGVLEQWKFLENGAAEGPVSGMVFR